MEEAIDGEAFEGSNKATEDNEQTVLELRTKIGQLTMEVVFLEQGYKGTERLTGPNERTGEYE